MNEIKYHTVCIAYAQIDEGVAKAICASLQREGVAVSAAFDAPPGTKLRRAVDAAIDQADRLIVLCSKESKGDGYVDSQIHTMRSREFKSGGPRNTIIPLLLPSAKAIGEGVYLISDWENLGDRVVAQYTPGDPLSPRVLKALQVRP